jgi:NodT family efflux transporter outer membrane factor (OMF) lipoprotein
MVSLPLLAACTVGPDFVPPKADVPKAWTASNVSDNQPQDDWWASFHDPVLSSLIARAAAANLDLRQAALRIAEARAQGEIAAGDQWPSVGANASYASTRFSDKTAQGSLFSNIGNLGTGTGLSIPSFPNPYDQFQVGFDASWEPDLFGGVRRSIEAAGADTAAAVEDRSAALVSLDGEVARSYVDLRAAQLKLQITQRDLATARDVLQLARDRRAAGVATELDVTEAAAQVTTTEAQLPLLEREITLDINQLSQLLAREPGALRAELAAAEPVPPTPPAIAIGLPGDLLRRRPDIRAAEARLHAATARVGVATAVLFPSVTLDASFGTQAERFPDLADWASRFFNVGPTLNIPIFEGGKLRATVRLQDIREQEAGVTYANTVLGAVHEVENALVAYQTEQTRRASLEATVKQNQETLTLARQRYSGGVTTFLDVLDAERTLQQSELSLADSTAAAATDLVALYKALGGGWQETGQNGG